MINNSVKNILVPLDFSETSLNALQTAIAIAKQQNADILLLNVVDTSFMFGFTGVAYISEKTIDSMVNVSARMLNPLVEMIKEKHHLSCTSMIKVGLVPLSIAKYALENEASLIIMGTHGISGFREFFIGSTAQKVIRISSCPVLTVPPNKKWLEFKTILFPIRPITGAAEKYDFLRKIIGHTDTAIKVLVLATTYSDPEKKLLHKFVKELKAKLTQDEIKISGNIKAGKYIPETVLRMSKSVDADMIAITVNNDPAFKQFFIGPFEQHIINHATVPVLSIRPKLANTDSQVVIQQMHESLPEQVPLFA